MIKSTLKNIGAIIFGFIVIIITPPIIIYILELFGIFSSDTSPGIDFLFILIISTLLVALCSIIGGYITARLAPENYKMNVLILAALYFIYLLTLTYNFYDWYTYPGNYNFPIFMLVSSPFLIWIGGKIFKHQ